MQPSEEEENSTPGANAFRVAGDDVKALTEEGGDITPEILQALLDADRLEADLKLAEEQAAVQEAAAKRPKKFNKWGDEEAEEEVQAAAPVKEEEAVVGGSSVHAAVDARLEGKAKSVAEEAALEKIVNGPQRRDARVLAVEKSRVLMHIDGRGIRPFLMSGGCFGENSTQHDLYARERSERGERLPGERRERGANVLLLPSLLPARPPYPLFCARA